MPNQRAKDKRQVSAWIPTAQYVALKVGAVLLGLHISDLIARLVERYAASEIEAMKKERERDVTRMVASNVKGNTNEGRC